MRLLLSDITPSKAMLHSPQGGHSVGPWWGNSPALSSKARVPTEASPVCRSLLAGPGRAPVLFAFILFGSAEGD